MNKDEKPLWMYWVLLAALLSPALFIAGIAIGSNARIPSEKAWEYISLTISAIATSVIALLTIVLAVETWRLRRNQDEQIETNRKEAIRPHVEIFLESSVVGFQFILFKVENIGRGLAKNVKFELVYPERELLDGEKEIITTLEKLSFFKNSLSTLGVGGSKKSFLFSFIDMHEKYGKDFYDTKLSFQISFKDMEGNLYTTYSIIDLSEFKGITEIGKGNPSYRTSIELEKMRKTLDSIVKGNQRVNIDSYSQNDRDNHQQMIEEKYLEHLNNKEVK